MKISTTAPPVKFTNQPQGIEGEMEKAYEEYFESLAKGEEALSFAEFKEALS
ncbi:hypothetical protein M4W13_07280 [Citrobacter cronae]|uniref:hypothetical protein n=1 Tax=Citrobacter cronae TaxID=1748967 RepID=UPI0020784BCD|nr:hypothetical protein [Citrobacter cronae]MCM8841838.1 hypothetical protein [Citrobacter cronae]